MNETISPATSAAFVPIFVGGAPRTGTTLLHALICTSPKCNDFIGEASYLTNMMNAYHNSTLTFSDHTRYYFNEQREFMIYQSLIVKDFLFRTWERLGCPKILALKDPTLTYYFHHLAEMLPEANFVASIRNPRYAVSSRVDVDVRSGSSDPDSDLRQACDVYASTYRTLLDNMGPFRSRIAFIDYDKLVEIGSEQDKVRDLVEGIDPGKLWKSEITRIENHLDNEWATELLGGALSDSSVGRSEGRLTSLMSDTIQKLCGAVADRAYAAAADANSR